MQKREIVVSPFNKIIKPATTTTTTTITTTTTTTTYYYYYYYNFNYYQSIPSVQNNLITKLRPLTQRPPITKGFLKQQPITRARRREGGGVCRAVSQ